VLIFLNLFFFKVVWAASLAGVVFGYEWSGLVMLAVFIAWHARTSPTARADFFLAVIAMAIGLLLDTLYIRAGLIVYEGSSLWQSFAPLWILGLWANFALTMNGCLGWLQQRRMIAGLLAAVCGPASYFGGVALGTARVTGDPWLLFGAIGLAWAIALPLLLTLSARFSLTFYPEQNATVRAQPGVA
jgi:hypothetical protein